MRYLLMAIAVLCVIGGIVVGFSTKEPMGLALGAVLGLVSAAGYLAAERVIYLLEQLVVKLDEVNSTGRQGVKVILGEHKAKATGRDG